MHLLWGQGKPLAKRWRKRRAACRGQSGHGMISSSAVALVIIHD